jgi:hypothetical protein
VKVNVLIAKKASTRVIQEHVNVLIVQQVHILRRLARVPAFHADPGDIRVLSEPLRIVVWMLSLGTMQLEEKQFLRTDNQTNGQQTKRSWGVRTLDFLSLQNLRQNKIT